PPSIHDGLELRSVAEAVGIVPAVEQLLEYGEHVRGDRRIDRPQLRQVKAAAFRRVPPGQQEVRHDAALSAVATGDSDQAFQGGLWGVTHCLRPRSPRSFRGWPA